MKASAPVSDCTRDAFGELMPSRANPCPRAPREAQVLKLRRTNHTRDPNNLYDDRPNMVPVPGTYGMCMLRAPKLESGRRKG